MRTRIRVYGSLLAVAAFFLFLAALGGNLLAQQAAPPPAQKPVEVSGDEARAVEVLEKHIATLGGRENIHPIESVERVAELEVFGMVNKTYNLTDRKTRRFYQRSEGQQGVIESGYDGKRIWRKTAFFRGYVPETDPAYRRFQQSEFSLLDYRESGRKYFRRPDEKVGDTLCYVVEGTVPTPAQGEVPIKYYFDSTTYMIRQTVVGADITNTTQFEDYRQVDGRWAAFKNISKGPNQTSVQRVTSIRYNVSFDPSIFEYKEGSSPQVAAAAPPAKADAPPSPPAQPAPASAAAPALPPAASAAARPAPAAAPTPGIAPVSMTPTASPAPLPRFRPADPIEEKMRLDTFELVWKTVDDTYWDQTFGGVNWKAIHDKYLPRAMESVTSEEFHRLMNQMVGELDRSHFRVIPPDRVANLNTRAADLQNGAVGLGLKWLEGQLVVNELRKDFPAEAAGIRKGYAIRLINGKTPDELLAANDLKNPGFQLREALRRVRAAAEEMGGKPGEKVSLEVLNEKDEVVKLDLIRKAVPLNASSLEFESRILDGNIGYIRMNIFFGDAVEQFRQALTKLSDTRGLIVDLRGNPGGVGAMGPTIAGWICPKAGSLGALQFRFQTQEYKWPDGKSIYSGKVVVLVDSGSGSASEVFSGGLQELGCATVVGETTAGAVLPSTVQPLPTGAAFQHVVSDFRTPKGIQLEGRGVIPDVKISPTRAAMLAGKDPALDRAAELLRKPS